jgi:hypothetical protein
MFHNLESIRKTRRRCVDGRVKPGHDGEAHPFLNHLDRPSDQQLTLLKAKSPLPVESHFFSSDASGFGHQTEIGGRAALRYLGSITERVEGSGDEREPSCRGSTGVASSSSGQGAGPAVTDLAPESLRQAKR